MRAANDELKLELGPVLASNLSRLRRALSTNVQLALTGDPVTVQSVTCKGSQAADALKSAPDSAAGAPTFPYGWHAVI